MTFRIERVNNRHVCSACRLKKCFANRMEIERLRASYRTSKKNKSITTKSNVILLKMPEKVNNSDCFIQINCIYLQFELPIAARIISHSVVMKLFLAIMSFSTMRYTVYSTDSSTNFSNIK
jgi:hypothetical protein